LEKKIIQEGLGLSSQQSEIIEKATALLKNYNRYPVEFVKGEGAYLYDKEGKVYLDFLCGIAVTSFGHSHNKIKSAVESQVNKFWHVSNLFESGPQELLAQKLAEKSGLDNVFFCNSGTEANEAAIKFARKWGKGKSHIITAFNSFHGRTMGSLSASGQNKLWEGFFPLTPGFSYTEYGDIAELEHSYSEHPNETIAVMLEPIQGESGILIPPPGYLKSVDRFCKENNLLLIIDEVQSGMGRTGRFFAHQWEEIKPDIICVAKGIANGLPLGAVICTKEVGDEIKPGSHGSTFGGNPVSIAAANVVVELIDESTLNHIIEMGNILLNALIEINNGKIKEIRGKGLMIGVEFREGTSAKKIAGDLLNNGVVTGTSGDNVLRILPPFIITDKEIEFFINEFKLVVSKS
jgi:acetylornithine/N-succinyldiaminopimelate aminotransferase